jgi:hypothetical protein
MIFADHRALEECGGVIAVASDKQKRNLAQRGDRVKPVRLVREIDIAPLETDTLFGKHDGRSLHVRAEMMADERQC